MSNTPEQFVEEFLTAHRTSGVYQRDTIARLAELSISNDRELAEAASKVLFTKLVEPLADSFKPSAVSLYNRALAQVIQVCRQDPQAADLDRELGNFGLTSEEDLVVRVEKLRRSYQTIKFNDSKLHIKRVIVLSRVTIGADIAVTSPVMERMKREFSLAEIVLIGGAKAIELLCGDSRVCFEPLGYSRSGTTIDRLSAWIELLSRIRRLTAGLDPDEFLIVDPDSRLTQLGLLPLKHAVNTAREHTEFEAKPPVDRYLFFPSREYGNDTSSSLGELTSLWLDEVFDTHVRTYPTVRLSTDDIHVGRSLVSRIRRASRPVITLNFGVGGNPRKRISDDFEVELVTQLLKKGASIVLDKGAGEEEQQKADAVVTSVTQLELDGRLIRVSDVDEDRLRLNSETLTDDQADILVWNGRVGILAALIGESDLYIGYDSAGQHIAAALGVKCIDVFAGFSSQRFVDRWRPDGRAESRVITPGTQTTNPVEQVLAYVNEIL